MAYTALPDRRISYDNDGTVVGYFGTTTNGYTQALSLAQGVATYPSGATLIEINDDDTTSVSGMDAKNDANPLYGWACYYFFFPETKTVTGYVLGVTEPAPSPSGAIVGSVDSTNGVDGTWETASLPGGAAGVPINLDGFRTGIKAVSFSNAKKVIVIAVHVGAGGGSSPLIFIHLYGQKGSGQTPDDIVFLDFDGSGTEFTIPEDYGDQPLGTTVVRQFRIKNVSGTKTANTIVLLCNDTDFSISSDGTTWVTTLNISSLAAGASSATLYSRCVTPGAGSKLGPRFNRIVCTVASFT